MVTLPDHIQLTRSSTGRVERARIETLTREDAKMLVDASWWVDLRGTLRNPEEEPDRHWDWRQLISIHQNKPFFRAVCVKSGDGAIQAAMLVQVGTPSALTSDGRAVLIERLAAAPRNRDELVQSPMFRGAGTGLLVYAMALSHFLGFSGSVNLFPIANVEFYEGMGFVATSIVEEGETLYELPTDAALRILQDRGLIDG